MANKENWRECLPDGMTISGDGADGLLSYSLRGAGPDASCISEIGDFLEAAPDAGESFVLNSSRSDERYIYNAFRAISARYLGAPGGHLDFSGTGVLKKALPLFLPKKLGGARLDHLKFVRNHSRNISDTLGIITQAKHGGKAEGGSRGINVETRIALALHPEIAVGLADEPPLYDNVSIMFTGRWKKSHPDMGWEFWVNLGNEIDGEIVRVIMTEITGVHHLGLVDAGADEHAKSIKSLQSNVFQSTKRPNKGNAMENFTLELTPAESAAIAAQLGDGVDEVTAATVGARLTELTGKLDAATQKLAELKGKAALYDAALEAEREETKAAYLKTTKKPVDAMLTAFETMDVKALREMRNMYAGELNTEMPATCTKCGTGEHIQRRSSQDNPQPDNQKNNGRHAPASAFTV